ncbi:hypothetical protein M8818_003662 [Zalaria obscura]|uniref:Uncharacterized protein n=1 Tax=Zalaria obscura TaxID=2024903 RepID=A0ACC3SEL1_9PEZI
MYVRTDETDQTLGSTPSMNQQHTSPSLLASIRSPVHTCLINIETPFGRWGKANTHSCRVSEPSPAVTTASHLSAVSFSPVRPGQQSLPQLRRTNLAE